MILGIGTDFMRADSLHESCLQEDDAFLKKTFTQTEIEAATLQQNPHFFYALRFSAKEAVFKCLGINSDGVRMNEIEVLTRGTGQPYVVLHGDILKKAKNKGIKEVLISLTYDSGFVQAFAVAQ